MPAQAANAPSAEDKARYVGRLLEAVAKADTLPRLTELYVAAQKGPAEGHGVLGEVVDRAGTTVEEVLWQAKERLERGSAALKDDEPVEAEVVADEESGEVGDRAAVLDEPEQEAK